MKKKEDLLNEIVRKRMFSSGQKEIEQTFNYNLFDMDLYVNGCKERNRKSIYSTITYRHT